MSRNNVGSGRRVIGGREHVGKNQVLGGNRARSGQKAIAVKATMTRAHISRSLFSPAPSGARIAVLAVNAGGASVGAADFLLDLPTVRDGLLHVGTYVVTSSATPHTDNHR